MDLDGQTFATWLRGGWAPRTGSRFTRLATEAVWCAAAEDLSLLRALFYCTGGGFDSLISTSGGAQQDRVVGGSQRLALQLAAGLGAGW